jgi:hypothetical protein
LFSVEWPSIFLVFAGDRLGVDVVSGYAAIQTRLIINLGFRSEFGAL